MLKSLFIFLAFFGLAFPLGFLIVTRLRQSKGKILLLLFLFGYLALIPLVIPPEFKILRFLVFPPLFAFFIKNIHLTVRKANAPDEPIPFLEYIKSNILLFERIESAATETSRPDYRGSLKFFFSGIYQISSGIIVIFLNTYFQTPAWSWPIATILKMGCFYWFAAGATDFWFGFLRLLGKEIVPIYREPIRAVSPEDLWSNRLNLFMRQYLVRFVFLPVGGAKYPNWGILATFIASGLIHEYQFDLAASGVSGYVLAYFVLQGLGVAGERKLKRFLRKNHRNFYEKAAASRLIPYIFVPVHTAWAILTGLLLIKSLDRIVDLFNLGIVHQILQSLPLPPFPF